MFLSLYFSHIARKQLFPANHETDRDPFFPEGLTLQDFIMRNAAGTYWCKGCGHHSSSRRDLQRHIEARHISGDYVCQFCNKSMTTKYNLQRHINKVSSLQV